MVNANKLECVSMCVCDVCSLALLVFVYNIVREREGGREMGRREVVRKRNYLVGERAREV